MWIDGQMGDGCVNMDGWISRWMNGWMDGRMTG